MLIVLYTHKERVAATFTWVGVSKYQKYMHDCSCPLFYVNAHGDFPQIYHRVVWASTRNMYMPVSKFSHLLATIKFGTFAKFLSNISLQTKVMTKELANTVTWKHLHDEDVLFLQNTLACLALDTQANSFLPAECCRLAPSLGASDLGLDDQGYGLPVTSPSKTVHALFI